MESKKRRRRQREGEIDKLNKYKLRTGLVTWYQPGTTYKKHHRLNKKFFFLFANPPVVRHFPVHDAVTIRKP